MFLTSLVITETTIFFISCPDECSAEASHSLRTSTYLLVNGKIDIKPKAPSGVPLHRTIFRYANLRYYFAEAPILVFLKNRNPRIASIICELGILNFILHKRSRVAKKFWKISNKILNKSKPSVPTIINGAEVISSSSSLQKKKKKLPLTPC